MSIGTAGPLSNAEALFGNTWQNGMQLAIDEANAAGGINGEKLVLVREDDQGDPKQGTLIAQKFCDDDSIVAVVANFNSGVTIPSSDVYNRCGMPQVTNSSNPKVTAARLREPLPARSPTTSCRAARRRPMRWRRWAPRRPPSSTTSRLSAKASRRSSAIRSRKAAARSRPIPASTATDVDFSAVITQLKTEAPDVVYYGGTMPGVGLFLKQLRELGVKGAFFAADPAFLPDLITTAGPGERGRRDRLLPGASL